MTIEEKKEMVVRVMAYCGAGLGLSVSFEMAGGIGGIEDFNKIATEVSYEVDTSAIFKYFFHNIDDWVIQSREDGVLFSKDTLIKELQARISDRDVSNREFVLLTEQLTKIKGWIAPVETRNLNYNAHSNADKAENPLNNLDQFKRLMSGGL